MFPNRLALRQAIRALAKTIERESARAAAGAEFEAWLTKHRYIHREPPSGHRSKVVAWSVADEWPGPIEWYTLDDTVIGKPDRASLFYEIPFADLERMPVVLVSRPASRRPRRAGF